MADMTNEIDPTDFFRDWITDASGNRVLAGLTAEETNSYVEYQKRRLADLDADRPTHVERDRWLELHDKHEAMRVRIICAEAERRQDDAPIN